MARARLPLLTTLKLLFTVCFILLSVPVSAETVRIGLVRYHKGITEAGFSVSTGYNVTSIPDRKTMASENPDKPVTLKADGTGISLTKPDGSSINVGSDVEITPDVPGGIISIISPRRKEARYRGVIEVHRRNGCLELINRVDVEDYLLGVVPGEMPSHFHPEALKAQSVAARTYALAVRDKHKKSGYELCDDINCQVYLGISGEKAATTQAIKDTVGLVMTYEDKLIDAQFCSDCGGRTKDGNKPYLKSVPDKPDENSPDYCSSSKNHAWSIALRPEKLTAFLPKTTGCEVPAVKSVAVKETDDSGRVSTIAITADSGCKTLTLLDLRRALGTETIRSGIFTVAATEDGTFVIKGKGWGHGVGLCQFGANGMAASPYRFTFDKILKHYYTGIEITSLGTTQPTPNPQENSKPAVVPQPDMAPLNIGIPPAVGPLN